MAKDALGTEEKFSATVQHAEDKSVERKEESPNLGPQSSTLSSQSSALSSPTVEPIVRFSRADGPRTEKITHGDVYQREFKGAGPWTASEQEWDLFLKNTGAFKKI